LALAAAQEDLGSLRIAAGDPSESVETLTEAYETAVRCDAQHTAARLRRSLRHVGVVKRAPAVARPTLGWASLTDAELSVLKLVASGQTSRAAAEQLFVSTNTVNTHLRHIFTKLGLKSRTELVRVALDHDAMQPA
jgi:DNA-binding CsgD family transcriptional regulator